MHEESIVPSVMKDVIYILTHLYDCAGVTKHFRKK